MPDPRSQALLLAERAAEAGDLDAAFDALSKLELGDSGAPADREVALLWLKMLTLTPQRTALTAEARRLLDCFPGDPEVVLLGCEALIGRAERTPPDEAQPVDGPASLAAEAAATCLERADSATLSAADHTRLLTNRANALRLARDYDQSLSVFEQALQREPERGELWFDLGLLHKARRDYAEGLSANERAMQLLAGDPSRAKGALWNLAICATALGQGPRAAAALRRLGHEAKTNEAGMPYVEGLPPVQVRVASVGSGLGPDAPVPHRSVSFELLWVAPLSPCHGVVSSPSYRVTSVDYGDLVLWDGVPVAIATHEGRPLPRFPLLSVLRKGSERCFRFVALQHDSGDVAAMSERMPGDTLLVTQHERVEHLCPRCASGEHPAEHRHMDSEPHNLVYGKIVVPGDADLRAFCGEFDRLLHQHDRVQLVAPELLEALGDTAAAGKAHQMWRGIERSAEKRGDKRR